jgi:diguanylate cyclase (GGDEF)-like protein
LTSLKRHFKNVRMGSAQGESFPRISATLRQARSAWRLQYLDSRKSIALAEVACARAIGAGDLAAEGWARLARGLHRLRFGTRSEADTDLARARECFDTAEDTTGSLLAQVLRARPLLLDGRAREGLDLLLSLRERGLRLLRNEERSMLLNNIAGCHSELGESAQAFAYMYQALRETSTARHNGFDVVLYNNIGFELSQLGDAAEAMRFLDQGIERCNQVENPLLTATLIGNRLACLIELGRPRDGLDDVYRLLAMPADTSGRGAKSARFETMAIVALRAGEVALGEDLVDRAAAALDDEATADERIEFAVATAERLLARGDPAGALTALENAIVHTTGPDAPRPRTPCLLYRMLADHAEAQGESRRALQYLRVWQYLHEDRVQRASQARFQAAALQTDLLRLSKERDDIDARRRSSERAKRALEAMNRQLSQKVREVEALQAALREQAIRDFLTGLFNRRYLNEVLPAMLALAQRTGEPLSVAIIDFDHFKAINDRHGHVAGDKLLSDFGKLVAARLRKSDVACRYGGEEFCLLLPGTDATTAKRKLVALQDEWRRREFTLESAVLHGCTFSAGVADSLTAPASIDVLLRAADEAGFEAKRLGRDRVVVARRSPDDRPLTEGVFVGTVAE